MYPKYARDISLVEVLEQVLDEVPVSRRLGLGIEFSTCEKTLRKNLENIYKLVTQRLLHLSYYLEWSLSVSSRGEDGPKKMPSQDLNHIPVVFCELSKLNTEHIKFLNGSFSAWINNQVVRELNEFLKVYLIELHEVCTVIKRTKKPITPREVIDIKDECTAFEKGSLKDRLTKLKKEFGFELKYHRELLSLYELRNIFSHYDGIVTKKLCNKDGYLEVVWPRNAYYLKKRGHEKWVEYHKTAKPISSKDYDRIEIRWLGKASVKRYKAFEQIKLGYKDLNDIICFYLHVINELHSRLVTISHDNGFKVAPFNTYANYFSGVSFNHDS